PPDTPGGVAGLPTGREKPKGSRALRDSPRSHTSQRRPHFFAVESDDIADVESIEPPIAVLSLLIVEVSLAAGVVSSAFLPQPTATYARASAMSARAKSLRIVCTFTSSQQPTRARDGRASFSIFKAPSAPEKNTTVLKAVSGRVRPRWFFAWFAAGACT